jgi:hypothetical protein
MWNGSTGANRSSGSNSSPTLFALIRVTEHELSVNNATVRRFSNGTEYARQLSTTVKFCPSKKRLCHRPFLCPQVTSAMEN